VRMQALRRRFVLVAVGVLVPVALLVWRALGSVAVERRTRHEVVAERLFDEMERALSGLLAREEARPVEAYGVGGPVPLAPATDQPFVIGWFEIDPRGGVRTAEAGLSPLAADVGRAAQSLSRHSTLRRWSRRSSRPGGAPSSTTRQR